MSRRSRWAVTAAALALVGALLFAFGPADLVGGGPSPLLAADSPSPPEPAPPIGAAPLAPLPAPPTPSSDKREPAGIEPPMDPPAREARPPEAPDENALADPPEDSLRVLVRRTDGTPCPDARIRFNRHGLVWPWITTGPDGRCVITAESGADGTVEVAHPFALGETQVPLPARDRQPEITVTILQTAGAVRVRLQPVDGGPPFNGVGVLIPHAGSRTVDSPNLGTNEWHATGVSPGRWTLRIVPAYSPYLPVYRVIDVAPGAWQEIEIALSPGHTLAGVVVDAQGAPVAGAEIKVNAKQQAPLLARAPGHPDGPLQVHGWARGIGERTWMVTDGGVYAGLRTLDDGRFEFAGLAKGELELRAEYQGQYIYREPVAADNESVRIVVPAGPPAIRLVLERPEGAEQRTWNVITKGSNGRASLSRTPGPEFQLRDLPPGEQVVWAHTWFGEPRLSALGYVEVVAGKTTTLRMSPKVGATVKCTPVAAEDGSPLGHVWFRYRWRGQRFGPSSSIGGEMAAPPEADLVVIATSSRRKPVEQRLRFAAGERKHLGEIRFLRK